MSTLSSDERHIVMFSYIKRPETAINRIERETEEAEESKAKAQAEATK